MELQILTPAAEALRRKRIALTWAFNSARRQRELVQNKRAIGTAVKAEWVAECRGIERELKAMLDALDASA